MQKTLYAIGTGVTAAAAALSVVYALVSLGPCSAGMNLAFTLLLVLLLDWMPLLTVAVLGGVAGYYLRFKALAFVLAVLVLSGLTVGVRQLIPHATIPDGGPSCRIDL